MALEMAIRRVALDVPYQWDRVRRGIAAPSFEEPFYRMVRNQFRKIMTEGLC
jgi:hypothetical protein